MCLSKLRSCKSPFFMLNGPIKIEFSMKIFQRVWNQAELRDWDITAGFGIRRKVIKGQTTGERMVGPSISSSLASVDSVNTFKGMDKKRFWYWDPIPDSYLCQISRLLHAMLCCTSQCIGKYFRIIIQIIFWYLVIKIKKLKVESNLFNNLKGKQSLI